MTDKIERPIIVPSVGIRIVMGCGNLYINIGHLDNKPIETFVMAGHVMSDCTKSFAEALGRAISIGLQYGVPIEEYIAQFQGIQCPKPVSFPKDKRITSCPDGVAKAMRLFVSSTAKGDNNEDSDNSRC